MASRKVRPSVAFAYKDLRSDWRRWSSGERLTAGMIGIAVTYLGAILVLPGAAQMPW